jgi:hypothetical protein
VYFRYLCLLSDRMDHLELESIDLSFGNKIKKPNVAVHEYVEFIVNEEPLSELLNQHFGYKPPLLAKFTSTLGTMELVSSDQLKIEQLLGHTITEKELEKFFPAKHFDQKPILEELAHDKVLIYCCAECGDYKCSGIFARITKGPGSYTWLFEDNGKQLTFEFEKEAYEQVLKHYLDYLKPE